MLLRKGDSPTSRSPSRSASPLRVPRQLSHPKSHLRVALPVAAQDLGHAKVYGALHDELELLVEAGLTPLQALPAATLNPARFLNATDSLGMVEEGKIADLVLLDANPLEDIRHTREIEAVFVQGRLLRRASLDRLLREVEQTYASRPGRAQSPRPTTRPLATITLFKSERRTRLRHTSAAESAARREDPAAR